MKYLEGLLKCIQIHQKKKKKLKRNIPSTWQVLVPQVSGRTSSLAFLISSVLPVEEQHIV